MSIPTLQTQLTLNPEYENGQKKYGRESSIALNSPTTSELGDRLVIHVANIARATWGHTIDARIWWLRTVIATAVSIATIATSKRSVSVHDSAATTAATISTAVVAAGVITAAVATPSGAVGEPDCDVVRAEAETERTSGRCAGQHNHRNRSDNRKTMHDFILP